MLLKRPTVSRTNCTIRNHLGPNVNRAKAEKPWFTDISLPTPQKWHPKCAMWLLNTRSCTPKGDMYHFEKQGHAFHQMEQSTLRNESMRLSAI